MDDGAFCLTYENEAGLWFIPTAPTHARSWRGPYATERQLELAIVEELGQDVTVTRTVVNGPQLGNNVD